MADRKKARSSKGTATAPATEADAGLERVLERIRQLRSFDFRNYKRATLRRRIERRFSEVGVRGYAGYLRLLEEEPHEVDLLISSLLIKLTAFFRDEELWEALRTRLVPELLARRRPNQELRVWSAGCATGEEAYSIAFLLADALGSRFSSQEVKVFGTDVDEAAIAHARRGVYSTHQLEGLTKEQVARWFTLGPEGYTVRKDIRRAVVFGVNNLVSDAPVSRIDLILCRNVFIYLDTELQRRVLARFHFALRHNGTLVLGKSELIPFASRIFECVDTARRIYRKDQRLDTTTMLQERLGPVLEQENLTQRVEHSREKLGGVGHLYRELLDTAPCPLVAASPEGVVTFWNRAASRLWGRPESEVMGRKLESLRLGGLSGEALLDKSALVRGRKSEREQLDGVVEPAGGGAPVALRVQVLPLTGSTGELQGLLYGAHDVTHLRAVEADLQRTSEELRTAYDKVSTSYEELRASNEELETTNEELQSTNAELDATNRELAHRSQELDLLTLSQRTIIRALGAAVVVLGAQGRISTWNLAAERLLGLTEREAVGQLLWSLHVPALERSLIARIRRAVELNRTLRLEDLEYQLPTGGRGLASLTLTPLTDAAGAAAILLFEDHTRRKAVEPSERPPRVRRERARS